MRALRTARRLLSRSHRDFHSELTPRQRSALVACGSFAVTVAGARVGTAAIRSGRFARLGLRDVVIDGMHVHHYVPGIALLAVSGAAGVRGTERVGVQCLVGATFGAGAGLVVDELPLLLHLRDVYWAEEGRWAMSLAASVVGVAGAYFSAAPLWRGLREEWAPREAHAAPTATRGRRSRRVVGPDRLPNGAKEASPHEPTD